jgi:hypothetical protein
MHHFDNVGLYDGLFVMQDKETKTLWNHITGEALYGPLVGRSLGPLGNVRQMPVKQALTIDADMKAAISDRTYFAGGRMFGTPPAGRRGLGGAPPGAARGAGPGGAGPGRGRATGPRTNPDATLAGFFVETLGKEDDRRPRMDMGLGIWTASTHRYYPMELIRKQGEALIDVVDERKLLVYIDPDTFSPAALFVESSSATLDGKDVRLDNGQVVRSGMLLRGGKRLALDQPQQVFTRWYGFSLTFPGTEVYGQ